MGFEVIELSEESFHKEVLKSDRPVVVFFWAPWSTASRNMILDVDELARTFDGNIRFAKLNTDNYAILSERYTIRERPSFIIFNRGQVVAKHFGYLPRETFEQWIRSKVSPEKEELPESMDDEYTNLPIKRILVLLTDASDHITINTGLPGPFVAAFSSTPLDLTFLASYDMGIEYVRKTFGIEPEVINTRRERPKFSKDQDAAA